MNTKVVTIRPKDMASAAWTRMRRRHVRHLPVVDDTRLVGIVSERDLGGRTGAGLRRSRRVQDLMTRDVVSVEPETTLRRAATLIRQRLIGSLPVVKDDRLVGIVTATDVFESLGRHATGPMSSAEQQLFRAPTSSTRLGGRPVRRSRSRVTSERPRTRRRPSQVEKREALTDRLPRPLKRRAGRTTASQIPANIRVDGAAVSDDDRKYIRNRLGMKLGKFATSIERVTVRVTDVNGPRGGIDQACTIKVVLSGLPSVVFQSHAASVRDAINGALAGAERAVRRSLKRRRTRTAGR